MSRHRVEISEPVVVSVSDPGETRWGYHQFPALNRLPDGRMLLMYADAEDASETHGQPAPAFVSADGAEWSPFTESPRPVRPHFAVTRADRGEYLIVPSRPYFDVAAAGVSLPDPVSSSNVYGTIYHYRCADLPEEVRTDLAKLEALRYDPDSKTWNPEIVEYDLDKRLAWRRDGSTLLPRPYFEHEALLYHGALLYPDYRVRFELPDGRIAPKGATWLMASKDNGKRFERRGLVASDPSGHDLQGEPTLEVTSDDRLICVVRRTDHVQKPMAVTWSEDGGASWLPTFDLFNFGVFPCLRRVASGPLVLSFGRPGVHFAVSYAGDGVRWDTVETIIAGDPLAVSRYSCGYTSLLAVGDDRILIAYSDFEHRVDGVRHKAICVREIRVR